MIRILMFRWVTSEHEITLKFSVSSEAPLYEEILSTCDMSLMCFLYSSNLFNIFCLRRLKPVQIHVESKPQ